MAIKPTSSRLKPVLLKNLAHVLTDWLHW